MTNNSFKSTCIEAFNFLVRDFGYRFYYFKGRDAIEEVIYKTDIVAVSISFDPKERDLVVMLHRLVEGKISKRPIFIRNDIILNSFDFDDLLNFKNAEQDELRKMKRKISISFSAPDLTDILNKYSGLLKVYALDVLKGDFSMFDDLDKIVKERTRRIRNGVR